jgi:hypothetical protein
VVLRRLVLSRSHTTPRRRRVVRPAHRGTADVVCAAGPGRDDRHALLDHAGPGPGAVQEPRLVLRHGRPRRAGYSARPPRYEYFLTESGEDLFGILLAFREWGERRLPHRAAEAPTRVVHRCGAELHVETVCAACREPVSADDLRYR